MNVLTKIMFSGQSEKTVFEMISEGGNLHSKYKKKYRTMAFVYADIDKNRCSNLISQFFSQLHYTSGEMLDFFLIGYRSEKEFKLDDTPFLNEVSEITISKTNDNIPMYFDSGVFHEHNNFYQTINGWSRKLNNSSFYMVFHELYDCKPNLDNAYVVNFIKESANDDEAFMNEFVIELREAIAKNDVTIKLIEDVLDREITKNMRDRIFKIMQENGKLLLRK